MGQTKWQRGKEPSHVRIYSRQMRSLAWLHLSGSATKVLLCIAGLERGDNNGQFFLSERKGAELTGLSRNTFHKSIVELIDKGFIYCTERGAFSRKIAHASCFGLTWAAGPRGTIWRAPSHAYEAWRPDGNSRDQNLMEAGPISDTSMETEATPGAILERGHLETPLTSVASTLSDSEPHTSNQAIGSAGTPNRKRKQVRPDYGPEVESLREQLRLHLQNGRPGEQNRIAVAIDCPSGTLSKFIHGRNLPEQYRAALAAQLMRAAA